MRVALQATVRHKRRLPDLGVVMATVAVLPITVFVLWSCGWYSGISAAREVDAGPSEREGIVWQLERAPATETLYVSSTRLGFDTTAVTLTPHTLILVGDKEGGVGDLGKGARIRVIYQRREAKLVALCVEFLIRMDNTSPSKGCRSSAVLDRVASSSL